MNMSLIVIAGLLGIFIFKWLWRVKRQRLDFSHEVSELNEPYNTQINPNYDWWENL